MIMLNLGWRVISILSSRLLNMKNMLSMPFIVESVILWDAFGITQRIKELMPYSLSYSLMLRFFIISMWIFLLVNSLIYIWLMLCKVCLAHLNDWCLFLYKSLHFLTTWHSTNKYKRCRIYLGYCHLLSNIYLLVCNSTLLTVNLWCEFNKLINPHMHRC